MRAILPCFMFLAAALLSASEAGTPPDGGGGKVQPLEIPVVRTWHDLRNAPPLTLADGQTVRLGIEAREGPAGAQVLLYLLGSPNFEPASTMFGLGPLLVKNKLRYIACDKESILAAERNKSDKFLWCQTVTVPATDSADATRFELTQKHITVAVATLKPNGVAFQPWLRLFSRSECEARDGKMREAQTNAKDPNAEDDEEEGEEDEDPVLLLTSTSARATCRVSGALPVCAATDAGPLDRLPHLLADDDLASPRALGANETKRIGELIRALASDEFDTREAARKALAFTLPNSRGILAQASRNTSDPETLSSLKRIMNADTQPPIRLEWSKDGKDILVHGAPPLDSENYLFRWWINGKAFCPPQKPAGSITSLQRARMMGDTRLRIDFRPEVFGAKKGDTITVQVLFASDGSEWGDVDDRGFVRILSNCNTSSDDRSPRISNKLEFVVK